MSDSRRDLPGAAARVDEAIAEYLMACDSGASLNVEEWLSRYSDCRRELEQFLADEREAWGEFQAFQPRDVNPLEETTDFSGDRLASAAAGPRSGRDELAVPARLGGYRIERLLGVGGMGRVYEASDSAGHRVAIKLLSRRYAKSAESLQRFKQEGAIASAINHPRCVFVKAADESQGQPYIVMELMTGKTLRDLVITAGKLTVREALAKVMDILEGLREAHLHGMIHRDIKPANCYLESNGRVKLGDFGLARSIVNANELTQTGNFVGTPLFASPEQIRGEKLDERTDLYSVCATLYYLLTGQAPFANSSATQVIAKIVSEDPIAPRLLNPLIPAGLEKILLKGLQRDRLLRFQSVEELVEALAPFLTGRQLVARLGKRAAAYGIDFLIFSLYGILYGMIWNQRAELPEVPDFPTYTLIIAPMWLYNFVMEARWNATLGKLVMRLRVVNTRTGERPSLLAIFWRSTVYTLMSGVLTDLWMYGFVSNLNLPLWSIWQTAGYSLSYLLNCLPLLLTGGRLLLHDLVSGTSVTLLPERSPAQPWARLSAWQPHLYSADRWPSSFGGYRVRGLIWQRASKALLLADDRALQRQVWLWVRPQGESPVSGARQSCDRTTRPRWLTGGSEQGFSWDAFLAGEGAPLPKAFPRGSSADWHAVGNVCTQVLDELDRSQADQTAVPVRGLEQIWITSRGRVCLLDWPIPLGPDRILETDESEPPSTMETPILLRETARQMLTGQSEGRVATTPPVAAIVPISARRWLDQLDQATSNPRTPWDLAAGLKRSLQSPPETTLVHRLGTIGLSVITLAALFIVVLTLCRLGTQLALSRLADQLIVNRAMQVVLSEPTLVERLLFEQPQLRGKLTADKIQDLQEAHGPRLREAYRIRFLSLSSIHQSFASVNGIRSDLEPALDRLSPHWNASGPLEIRVSDWRQPWSQIRQPITAGDLARHLDLAPRTDLRSLTGRSPAAILAIVLALPLLAMFWAGLMRGGIPNLAIGLRLVRADGRPAAWWQYLLKSGLVWLPFLALLLALVGLDIYHPEWHTALGVLSQLLFVLPIVYAIVAIVSPRRGPHDWILGTTVVPK